MVVGRDEGAEATRRRLCASADVKAGHMRCVLSARQFLLSKVCVHII